MHLKTTTAFVYSCALLLGPAAPSQKAALQAPQAERFLFVVDTSSSMKRLDAANRQTLFDLIYEGLNGRMRSNDTFGVWTFDENAYAGEFPMQIWNPQKNLDLASQAATFLKGRQYKGETRFEPVVNRLLSVVRSVKDVNIFIISDGDTAFAGTAADQAVNAAYEAQAKKRRRAKKPFVTTLVARGGRIVTGSVVIAGEPIQLPDRPVAVNTVKTANSTNSNSANITATTAPTQRLARPLIIRKSITTMDHENTLKPTNSGNSLSDISANISRPDTNQIAPTGSNGELRIAPKANTDQIAQFSDSEPKVSAVPKPDNPEKSSSRADDKKPVEASMPFAASAPSPSGALSLPVLTVAAREATTPTNLVPPTSAALTAVAVTTEKFLAPRTRVLIGAGLFLVALGVMVWSVKRYRSVPQSSFISRSMDRG